MVFDLSEKRSRRLDHVQDGESFKSENGYVHRVTQFDYPDDEPRRESCVDLFSEQIRGIATWLAGTRADPAGVKLRAYVFTALVDPEILGHPDHNRFCDKLGVSAEHLDTTIESFRKAFPLLAPKLFKLPVATATASRACRTQPPEGIY